MKKMSKPVRSAIAVSLALCMSVPSLSAIAQDASSALIPIREAAAQAGAKVTWDAAAKRITVTQGSKRLVLDLKDAKAEFNGQPVNYQSTGPLQITDSTTLIAKEWLSKLFTNTTSVPQADTADQFLQYLQSGDGASAAKLMSPALQQALPAQALSSLLSNYEKVYGKIGEQTAKAVKENAVHRNVAYTLKAAAAPLQITVRLNKDNLVDDLNIAQAQPELYQKPAYDHQDAYTEEEVTIGEGTFALPGTLTKPKGNGPFPVVVLVHGSGPQDRDSSAYGGKPLRDLAAGLASEGIAVLRYDKITYEHTFKIAALPKFTLKDETVKDALAAVQLLKGIKDIDASRIFVAGHSQGGFAMPLIEQADTTRNIAGTILLSAPSSRFVDVTVKQQDELISRVKQLGQDTAPYEQQAAVWKSIAQMVNDPQYSTDNMPANFPLSPAYWWYEQRDYKPTDLAKQQQGPMLILQGENDWQVPMSEFNTWKKELKDRKDVEYKSYPKVNHLLSEVNTLSTGQDYMQPLNVSPAIIQDIAAWIKKTK
ncbi:hypothetical protein DCC85_03355 [Paenibacillus sp. CAA11]|uniref:alpha/beta hydrolase family protein n=1 Tax=Paenibacillus sp. CAA11 TaxID=1532905 RepID=UPI000D346629|nr:alpha/beta fold hydrolase [Paenibacillus sp. CAA11]AWB43353.1 hypothetical protein DCC85_03355 [Paenibacillus sp. CAA11]